MKHWTEILRALGANDEIVRSASIYPSLAAAWADWPRGDWMLWLWGLASGIDRRKLVLAACQCARLSLQYVPEGETRPLVAIETAEAWARGKATRAELSIAANGAAAAAIAAIAAGDAEVPDASYAAIWAAAVASSTYADSSFASDAASYAAAAAAAAANAAIVYADASSGGLYADASAFAAACAAGNAAGYASLSSAFAAASEEAWWRVLRECADVVRAASPRPPRLSRCQKKEVAR